MRNCVVLLQYRNAGLKIVRTAAKGRTWCCRVKAEAITASLGPMYVLNTNLTGNHGSLFLRFWSKIQCEPLVCTFIASQKYILLFPSPTLYVDSIPEISLAISLLPTEKKTASGKQDPEHLFSTYLKIHESYDFSESRFGIYA